MAWPPKRKAHGGGRGYGAHRTPHLVQLINGSRSLYKAWASGNNREIAEDTLRFADLTGVGPMIETYRSKKRPRLTRHDETAKRSSARH